MAENSTPTGEPTPDATPSPEQPDDDNEGRRGCPTCFVLDDAASSFDLANAIDERLMKLSGLLALLRDKSPSEYNQEEVNSTFWALGDLVDETRLLFDRYSKLMRREGKP